MTTPSTTPPTTPATTLWYYSTNGQSTGPVDTEFLIALLKAGRLTLVDLVFKEGASEWTTIGETTELSEMFGAVQAARIHDRKAANAPGWIVLTPNGQSYVQSGPFTMNEIMDKIGTGEIKYAQYAWRPGCERWERIGDRPEFDRRSRAREAELINSTVPLPTFQNAPELPAHEILASVVHLDRSADPEAVPLEAMGADLVKKVSMPVTLDAELPLPIDRAEIEMWAGDDDTLSGPSPDQSSGPSPDQSSGPSPDQSSGPSPDQSSGPEVKAEAAEASSVKQEAGQTPQLTVEASPAAHAKPVQRPPIVKTAQQNASADRLRRTIFAAFCGGAVVVLGLKHLSKQDVIEAPHPIPVSSVRHVAPAVAASNQASHRDPANEPENQPAKQDDFNPEKRSSATSGLPAILPAKGRETPTVLDLMPLKLASTDATLVLQTDARVGDKIALTIDAPTGQILELASYHRTFEITRANGEVPTFDLAALKLPHGAYTATATLGTLKTSVPLFLGTDDKEFRTARERHMKTIAIEQQSERKALFYGAKRFEALSKNLEANFKKLKSQPAAWKKFIATWRKEGHSAADPIFALLKKENGVAYPQELAAFREAVVHLGEQSRRFDTAVVQRRDVAANADTAQNTHEFERLRKTAGKTLITLSVNCGSREHLLRPTLTPAA